MSDQADTLRRLMRERAGGDEGAGEDHAAADDQAAGLRRLMDARPDDALERTRALISRATVVTFASGKGGTGKSTIAANLGVALARRGRRVLLVDADFGLASLDLMLNVRPAATLEQVLDGEAVPRDALAGVAPNLWLLPAGGGMGAARRWEGSLRDRLFRLLSTLPWEMDAVFVDLGAGIQPNVVSLHSPLHRSVVVTTPEPAAVADAYGLMKVLRRDAGVIEFGVIVNRVTDGREGRRVHERLREVAGRFTDLRLSYAGHVPRDENFVRSTMVRKTLLDWEDGGTAVAALELMARRFDESLVAESPRPDPVGVGGEFGLTEEPGTLG